MGAEKKLEKHCSQVAKANGWWHRKFSSPSNRGVPDRIFIKEGKVIFIEFKAPGNKPTDMQEYEMHLIRKKGGNATWIDSIDEFKRLLHIHT